MIEQQPSTALDDVPEHRPVTRGMRLAFMVGLLVITLPFAIMVPWSMHGGRTVTAEVATASELVLLALVLASTSRLGRQAQTADA